MSYRVPRQTSTRQEQPAPPPHKLLALAALNLLLTCTLLFADPASHAPVLLLFVVLSLAPVAARSFLAVPCTAHLYLVPTLHSLVAVLWGNPMLSLCARLVVVVQCITVVRKPIKASCYIAAVNAVGLAVEDWVRTQTLAAVILTSVVQFLGQMIAVNLICRDTAEFPDIQTNNSTQIVEEACSQTDPSAPISVATQTCTTSETVSTMVQTEQNRENDPELYLRFFHALQHPAFIVDLNVNVQAAAPNIVNGSAAAMLRSHSNLFDEARLESSNCTLNELMHTFRRRVEYPALKAERIRINPKLAFSSDGDVESVYDVTVSTFDSNEMRMVGIVMMETPKDREKEKQVLENFKTSLICSLSHELFSPINSLIMALNLLPAGTSAQGEDYKAISTANAEFLHSKISDLIDYTKIELNDFKLEESEFNVGHLFDDLERILKYSGLQNGNRLTFKTQTSANRKLLIHADRSRIKQVLVKLITNANKYTKRGEIAVAAAEKSDDLNVIFSVRDTGAGMGKDKLDQIFASMTEKAKFLQEHNSGSTKLPGMGLEIAKRICECMGGNLRATSTFGKGSTFSFEIPICRIYTTPILEQREIPDISGSPTYSKSLTELPMLGMVPLLPIHNNSANKIPGEPATRNSEPRQYQNLATRRPQPSKWQSKRRGSGTLPHPMRGREMAAANRDLMYSLNRVQKLPAISERTETWDVAAEQLNEGAMDVKAKMLQYSDEKLKLRLGGRRMTMELEDVPRERRVTQEAASSANEELHVPEQEGEKEGVILITDDDAFNRMVLRGIISKLKIRTIEAVNGEEAVDAVGKSIKAESKCVILMILMDLNMPTMDGVQAAREIRKLEKAHSRVYKIPIVAVSAHNTENDQSLCFKAGMQEFASKPVQAKDVERIVKTYVNTTFLGT